MTKTLIVDARLLADGIGTYACYLIAGFARHGNGFSLRAIVNQANVERVAPFCNSVVTAEASMYSLREQLEIPWVSRGADLLHVPHYSAPLMYQGKLLVTIHDLIHITYPTFSRTAAAWIYARPMLHLVARKAAHIITVSEYSKGQIVERLRVPSSKVTVIHNAVGPHFRCLSSDEAFAEIPAGLSMRRPYILYVGNLKPHKNVGTLIRAFALLQKRKVSDHQLVVVGHSKKWKRSLEEECSRLGVEEPVRFIPYVSEELLPKFYAAAEVVVLPSFVEGFGLPVIEAMACGTPVICSRAGSLPEVAGDAAEYFDPWSVEDLAAAIERVIGSSDLRARLRLKGLARAKDFSWDEFARQHYQVYRDVLRN